MRATALCCAFAAIACGQESPEQASASAQPAVLSGPQGPPLGSDGEPLYGNPAPRMVRHCNSYVDLPDVYGFCLAQVAGRGHGEASADEICRAAGIWEDQCRASWVLSRATENSSWSIDALLEACPTTKADCRFEVLDSRPHEDVMVQVERCFQHAGRFSGDCIAHALDRWVRQKPSVEEIERVAQLTIAPDRVGRYLYAIKACFGTIDACLGSPKVKEACIESESDHHRTDEICGRLLQSSGTPQVPMGP